MNKYDLVVVGAGIQGVGIAHLAAKNGLSVLVVEKNKAAGLETSSNSSKLIHGGLRYLESLQFSLVYECLSERRFLLKQYPSLVKLKPFIIPVYKNSGRKSWWVYLGLTLYSILGGFRSENTFFKIHKSKWSELGFSTRNISAVFQYHDAQTDDQKLTQTVLKEAEQLGVEVFLEATLDLAQVENANEYTIKLNNGHSVKSKFLINTAGPWVNDVAKCVAGSPTADLEWVQGSHIVLDFPSSDCCFYFESPIDGRAFFVLPWKGHTMVGTTEVVIEKPNALITDTEIEYLLSSYQEYFPQNECSKSRIINTYSGVRVLPKGQGGASPNRRSRETMILSHEEKGAYYIAVYGGKLTSFRATAQKVVSLLSSKLG